MDELEGEGRKGPAWRGQSGVVGAVGRSQDQRESPRGKGRSCLHQAGHQGVCWQGVSGHSWGQKGARGRGKAPGEAELANGRGEDPGLQALFCGVW